MKIWSAVILLLLVSCGPSEEEIQARIDQAVEDSNPTTTTLPLPVEECNKFINEVNFVFDKVETNLDTLFEGEDYEKHLEFYAEQIGKLNSLEDNISNIKSRTNNELEILISLENYRSEAHEYNVLSFKNLLNFVPFDDPQFQKMFDTLNSADDIGSELKIRINNYKCEY